MEKPREQDHRVPGGFQVGNGLPYPASVFPSLHFAKVHVVPDSIFPLKSLCYLEFVRICPVTALRKMPGTTELST